MRSLRSIGFWQLAAEVSMQPVFTDTHRNYRARLTGPSWALLLSAQVRRALYCLWNAERHMVLFDMHQC